MRWRRLGKKKSEFFRKNFKRERIVPFFVSFVFSSSVGISPSLGCVLICKQNQIFFCPFGHVKPTNWMEKIMGDNQGGAREY